VPYAAASLVEDLEYHLHLVRAGKRVQFLDACTVYGAMPAEGKGVKSQRARWEGGRLFALKQYGPMLAREVLRGNLCFLEPLLDLLLLPLALHATAVLLMLAAPSAALRTVALFSLAVLAFHVFAAALCSRRGVRALRDLAIVPFYIGWKILLIPVLWQHSKSDASWVRTQRAPLPKEIRP
jgi:cellulose synthase/poly-beta-1,6-N-acetylglucosamine synthase-like glycosyltransferase